MTANSAARSWWSKMKMRRTYIHTYKQLREIQIQKGNTARGNTKTKVLMMDGNRTIILLFS